MAHFLVTGHTGFKGAWLTLLLKTRGHRVSGISLDPEPGGLFERANLTEVMESDLRLDLRNAGELSRAIQEIEPEYVIHMAAQSLVREGYRRPRETYEINVVGTMNLLEALAKVEAVRAVLVVTTDKVYLPSVAKNKSFTEDDPLGGYDPYSASKAMADILSVEWLRRADTPEGLVVRAGNVIGIGDVCRERLIPDIRSAILNGNELTIRFPEAIRPWQHVLDCLNSYLQLLEKATSGEVSGAWNVGPHASSGLATVVDVVNKIREAGLDFATRIVPASENMKEQDFLSLDSGRTHDLLGHSNILSFSESVLWCFEDVTAQGSSSLIDVVSRQIHDFESRVRQVSKHLENSAP